MAGDAIDLGDALVAKLHPAGLALRADAAAAVVMHHRALAAARLLLADARAHRDHDAARLVPGDHRSAGRLEAERRRPALGAIGLEIAAAHARGLDLEHHLAGPRRRVGEVDELDLAIAGKGYAAHGGTLHRFR